MGTKRVAGRKRKSRRGGLRGGGAGKIRRNAPGQKSTPEKDIPGRTHPESGGAEAKQPEYAWVAVEHRDAEGNPTFPTELIAGTYLRRYNEVPEGSEISVHVLAGYKPNPLMMVERKIYEIFRMSVQGWRRSGQIRVEVGDWRGHEQNWFEAMDGAKLEISDPGLPGPHNEKSNYVVTNSSFERKIVKVLDDKGNNSEIRMFEGALDIKETWQSAWRRQRAEVLTRSFTFLFAPLLVALGAGLTLWWVEQRPTFFTESVENRASETRRENESPNDEMVIDDESTTSTEQNTKTIASEQSSNEQQRPKEKPGAERSLSPRR